MGEMTSRVDLGKLDFMTTKLNDAIGTKSDRDAAAKLSTAYEAEQLGREAQIIIRKISETLEDAGWKMPK